MSSKTPATNGDIYRDALLIARDYSTDALLSFADAYVATVADTDLDDVIRDLTGERLRAVRTELARRERISRIDAGVASPAERRYEAWRELAQIVRVRADMLHVFDLCDYHIHDARKREAHASCPVCGGSDRLVITAGPPDLCWCRQCTWGGDVITATMSLRQATFRDAVAWLAELCNEQVAA